MTNEQRLAQAIDRQEITTLLHLYSRGIDRSDEKTLLGVWANGATLDYGAGVFDAREWSAGVLDRLRPMAHTMHALSNIIIDLDGDTARAETYCQAYHQFFAEDGGSRQMVVGGRYLDRLVRTAQGWRIAERLYVMDWNESGPSTCELGEGAFARFGNVGGRYPSDALYR
jgi:hypothetical protein